MTFLYREGFIQSNLAKRIIPPFVDNKTPQFLTEAEYNRLREVCAVNPRDRAIIEILLQTGIRLSELTRLAIDDLELFPKQDRLDGGPGSLVKLPFGLHKRSGQRYPFIYRDGSWLAPSVREQIQVLSQHESVPEAVFEAYATHELAKKERRGLKPSGTIYESNDLDALKSDVPLMDFISAFIDLRPVASGAVGNCPFHDDQHASFGVNREGNYWNCFAGCGGGTIIDFWMKWKGIEFSQAVSELADLLGVEK